MEKPGFSVNHAIIFACTFSSYLQITALRKTQSYVKASIVEAWVPFENETLLWETPNFKGHPAFFRTTVEAEKFLGILDSVFMFAYAMGLYLLGSISERFEPRLVLVFGMISSSILTFCFGFLTETFEFYSIPFYICIWLVNAVCQSACWPTVVKLMDNWYGKSKRGLIFGLWSSASSAGSIVGAYVSAGMLAYGYEFAFLVNASLLLAVAAFLFFGVVSTPEEIYGTTEKKPVEMKPSNCDSTKSDHIEHVMSIKRKLSQTVSDAKNMQRRMSRRLSVAAIKKKNEAISFFRALLIPGVIAYSLAYTCLKSVNYSFFFWLPYYLRLHFGWDASSSAMLATCFDWGGMMGSTVCGYVSDLLGKRSPVLSSMLVLSIFSLGGYASLPNNKVANAVVMSIVGFFINGATNLVSSAVTADLGSSVDSKEALSTVSGIIEGSGSFGAAIGQAILPLVAETFGWNSIFYMFMIMLFVAAVLLSKLCYRETKGARRVLVAKIVELVGRKEDCENGRPPPRNRYGSMEDDGPPKVHVGKF